MCVCVDVPDELIKCSPKNPMHALLPGENSEMRTSDYPFKGLIAFLHQHDFDIKPEMSLEELIKHDTIDNFVGISENTIDGHLAESLTRHCGSKKKLVVGSYMHKTIIEKELGITCLYVDFSLPDCELIKSSLKVPMHTLLPDEQLLMSTRDYLITFLRRHDFDVEPEMVNDSIDMLAQRLLDVESCEMECLKFFRLLLRDFIVKSGIDTENWMLFQFATVPKVICFPGSSYEIYPPVEIFSSNEYWKIETNAFRYRTSFSKIDPLYVYEYALSVYSSKRSLLQDLDVLVKKAKDLVQEAANMEGVERNKQTYPASGEITKSGTLMDRFSEEWKRAANEASAKSSVSNSDPSSGGGMLPPSGMVSRTSETMKQLCMAFSCVQPVD